MIKRIEKIQNIGRFRNASCAQFQFRKLTIIFGRNTYGKSTLGDLFASIASGNTESIIARKTIPNDFKPQCAIIKYQNGSEKEEKLSLNNNTWDAILPKPLKMMVFDDSFYHNNVFAARKFTRDTKENFSSFVLGVQGVKTAQLISDKRKTKSTLNSEINNIQKTVFKDIDNLDDFIAMIPTGIISEQDQVYEEKRQEYQNLINQKKDAKKIIERKDFVSLEWCGKFDEYVRVINECLQNSLKKYHEEARKILQDHIQNSFTNDTKSEMWIRQGVKQNNGEICQFCGQNLNSNSLDLLEIYKQNFDESFEYYNKKISKTISICKQRLSIDYTKDINTVVQENHATILSYHELESNEDFIKTTNEILSLREKLKTELDSWVKELSEYKHEIESLFEKKIEQPHKAIDIPSIHILLQINNSIAQIINKINTKGKTANNLIAAFKERVETHKILEAMQKAETEGIALKRNLDRLKLAEFCESYKNNKTALNGLANEIPQLVKELREDQNSFLNLYFERLNKHFQEFGSKDFKLEKGQDNRGHTPIYFLKIQFRGVNITEKELDVVLSESDRRALSLAVFWAQLSGLSQIEKKNTILVFDDSVTSFDDNRITSVHGKIASIYDSVRQIIILSHYQHEIASFLNTYKRNKDICFLSICSKNNESSLKNEDIDSFVMNEHEKERQRIFSFIEDSGENLDCSILRVIFEKELNMRFAWQINNHNIHEDTFSKRIDRLFEEGVINETNKKRCHEWRVKLNPPHHTFSTMDIEDKRKIAEDLIDFIYTELIPS